MNDLDRGWRVFSVPTSLNGRYVYVSAEKAVVVRLMLLVGNATDAFLEHVAECYSPQVKAVAILELQRRRELEI